MLLGNQGLAVDRLDPILAAVLGNEKGEEGHCLLDEALAHGRARVELRDWLYCLAKSPGTRLHQGLIQSTGQDAEKFVEGIEGGIDDEQDLKGDAPEELTPQTVAPSVLAMLEEAERIAQEYSRPRIDDAVLTLALLNTAPDEGLRALLNAWATEERMETFQAQLLVKIKPKAAKLALFAEDGSLNGKAFDASGRKFTRRLREDAASLGAKKITTRHLLYTLLGNESGLLPAALAVHGVDVKSDMHAMLARELARPGRKRNDGFVLTRESLFDAVVRLFEESFGQAQERGGEAIGELDVAQAFVAKQPKELSRLSGDKALDVTGVRAYMASAEPDEEEDHTQRRFTIREIEQNIKSRLFGQDGAIERILPWIKRLRFGLPREERPAAVFLFLGPTGAGKTQLAKELATCVFGDPDMMVFLEMGQYKTKESMSMFIGAPPGYVGYGEGKLTNGLKDKPECVVLFDEIEKADTQVFDTLLRFADEGVISDPAGPVRNGRKCIIVMTTNAGQTWLRDHLRENPSAGDDPGTLTKDLFEAAMKELREERHFRPEFLGRVDERITFLPFTPGTCRKIVDSVLDRELETIRKLKEIAVDVPDEVRELLSRKVHERSVDEGARAAPRTINECIITPMIDAVTERADEAVAATHLVTSIRGLSNIVVEVAP